jgi:hypothetical protein
MFHRDFVSSLEDLCQKTIYVRVWLNLSLKNILINLINFNIIQIIYCGDISHGGSS